MFELYVEKIKNVTTSDALTNHLDSVIMAAGFTQYRMALIFPTPHLIKPKAVIYSNCSPEWVARYKSQRFASKDPIIFLAMHQTLPIVWNQLPSFSKLPLGAERVMSEAKQFGLFNGISFPLRGSHGEFGVFSFITDEPGFSVEKNEAQLAHIVNYVLDAAIRINGNKKIEELKPLTPGELTCLFWAAEGKTSGEIAIILGITERTVRFRLDAIIKKLGASNRAHAIMMAAMAGLIHPELRFVEIEDKISPNLPFSD